MLEVSLIAFAAMVISWVLLPGGFEKVAVEKKREMPAVDMIARPAKA